MGGITSRVHDLERVKRDVSAKNLEYNLKRYVWYYNIVVLIVPKTGKMGNDDKNRLILSSKPMF